MKMKVDSAFLLRRRRRYGAGVSQFKISILFDFVASVEYFAHGLMLALEQIVHT